MEPAGLCCSDYHTQYMAGTLEPPAHRWVCRQVEGLELVPLGMVETVEELPCKTWKRFGGPISWSFCPD